MRQIKAAKVWFRMSMVFFALLATIVITQLSSFAQDLDNACLAVGQRLDVNYRLHHEHDGTLYFPLHNRCNPLYDTVSGWVNPVLTILAVALAVALCGALITHVRRRPRVLGH